MGPRARRCTVSAALAVSTTIFGFGDVDLSASRRCLVHAFDSGVIGCVAELREVFDERLAAPRSSHADRYLWDAWHVSQRDEDFAGRLPSEALRRETASETASSLEEAVSVARKTGGPSRPFEPRVASSAGTQYSMLRTPAASYFPEDLFERLCVELSEFGRSQLGCDAFTPPWLACYTDGAEMNWHSDAAHGPFAFVLSLTPTGCHAREDGDQPGFFCGGETLILKPHILDYWRHFDASRGLEVDDIIDRYDPQPFGRLLVFDGRLPHRVSRISGTRDPRRGRLVLTGWFAQPRIRAQGGLSDDGETLAPEAANRLDQALDTAFAAFQDADIGRVIGFLAIRIDVRQDGTVKAVRALCDTLFSDPADDPMGGNDDTNVIDEDIEAAFAVAPPHRAVKMLLHTALLDATFPARIQATTITLPLSFD